MLPQLFVELEILADSRFLAEVSVVGYNQLMHSVVSTDTQCRWVSVEECHSLLVRLFVTGIRRSPAFQHFPMPTLIGSYTDDESSLFQFAQTALDGSLRHAYLLAIGGIRKCAILHNCLIELLRYRVGKLVYRVRRHIYRVRGDVYRVRMEIMTLRCR